MNAAAIIPEWRGSLQPPRWHRLLREAFTDLADLLAYLELEPAQLDLPERPLEFGLRLPRGYAALMRKGDPHDPLLRQVLPSARELQPATGFGPDPVGDLTAAAGPGLLRKYTGRALVVATGACAIHCRYCFRRHYPYGESSASTGQWQSLLETLRSDPTITEVILSGGDPLMLSDARLAGWFRELATIGQLRRLRIHSRLPLVLPERVTPGLVELLAASPLQVLLVLHANHPRELSPAVRGALQPLAGTGITLLNQSVLLQGVNDSPEVLAALSERLFEAGVLPYYLHLLDRVEGAAHFEVEEGPARTIYRELLARLPGYLVPRLVREIPGKASKTPLAP